ncbi:MAG: bifunctional 4-hydroxy-2-oxoglutarate aldolase/2-dehydro-3-deoxy-phosphogluconate aldolase [Chloroflexi bacterium]|nr:bifunctional 4-hydroxy-2-oxoglutarate aldolase/2-dehydro-3-deoxy-phosphogluconate aldolase [Chloroflexota bacterium]
MARFSRLQVWNKIDELGLVPLFYNADVEASKQIVAALSAGGCKVIEFTNRGDRAFEVFRELIVHFEKADPSVILGIGSVLDPMTAGLYINLGANFIVGSVTNPEVARLCNRRKIPYFPGCATASEVSQAEELGVEVCKVFPGAELGGPSFVKAITAPTPWTKIMVTGGVDATWENIKGWFDAGVAAIGMGSAMVRSAWVKEGNWAAMTAQASQCLAWVRKARGVALYTGIEHVGLYPSEKASGADVAAWYEKAFGFKSVEGNSSFFLSGPCAGRVEVMKSQPEVRCHVAVRVSDFEAALADLDAKGIAYGTPNVKPTTKSVYLTEPDPAGNLVHLLWLA